MRHVDPRVLHSYLQGLVLGLERLLVEARLALEIHSVRGGAHASGPARLGRVLMDDGRFSVWWRGRECLLGQTLLYRLLHRLAASSNTYVPTEKLLEDVWGGRRSASAVRTAIQNL